LLLWHCTLPSNTGKQKVLLKWFHEKNMLNILVINKMTLSLQVITYIYNGTSKYRNKAGADKTGSA